jgi:hypothetical protein
MPEPKALDDRPTRVVDETLDAKSENPMSDQVSERPARK